LNILQQQQNNLNLTLPEKSDVTLFIQSLSNIAEQNNSAFKTLEPLPESVENFYHIVPVHGVMLGSYQQLGNFINDLLMEKRLINIGDFTFQATKDNGILSFDFVANSYYYDANANNPHESSPAHPIFQREEAFKFTRDPFLPMGNEIASDKCLLCDASIHALKMVGTMTIDGKLWALIQSPSSISLVKVGDKIGEEQIPIINITDHSVLLNNHFTLEMNHS